MELVRKEGAQSADDPFEFVMSTDAPDRVGDIIETDGWSLARFKRNPIALFGHAHDAVIGTWENVRVEDGALRGRLKMARAGTSRLVDEVRALLEQRILRAVSVGFMPLKSEPIDEKDPFGGTRFVKSELLETSVVSVPANADALATAKSMNLSPETLRFLTGEPPRNVSVAAPKTRRVAVEGTPELSTSTRKGKPMKLADKIVAAQDRVDELREQVADIMKTAEEDGRETELTDEEVNQLSELEAQIEAAENSLAGLKSTERALESRAARQAKEGVGTIPAKAKADEKPGDLLIKAAICELVAFKERKTIVDVQRERYADDARVEAIVKSATNVATTTAAGWAAELTRTDTAGFVAYLEGLSIYGELARRGLTIPFGDANAITIPREADTSALAGSFVQENATIPVGQGVFGSVTMNRFKMAIITTFTNELAEVSNPQIETVLRRSIVQQTARALDGYIMNPALAPVPNVRPASPWNGAANQASAGDTQADINKDLRFLMSTLQKANSWRSPVFVMSPERLAGLQFLVNANGAYVFRDELTQGRLMTVPVVVSTHCPPDHVFIIDAADFATAFGVPQFMASEQATLAMANDDGTDPTMAATGAVNTAGSINISDAAGTTPKTVVRSMMQTYATALRMVMPISWGTVRDGTRAYLTGVSW